MENPIPSQLKDWQFVLLKPGSKEPFELEWQKNLYKYNDPKLTQWIQNGGNYGVAGDPEHFIVDIDTAEIGRAAKGLPETLTQRTGGGGYHLFFKGHTPAIRLRNPNDSNLTLGDIQGPGKQVVGPGSVHPNGNKYTIVRNTEIAEISEAEKEIRKVFANYIKAEPPPHENIKKYKDEKRRDQPDITRIIDFSKLRKQGDEYYGEHPVHGSETGHNFWVNPSEGIWHCFRHGTGGDEVDKQLRCAGAKCHQRQADDDFFYPKG